MTSSTGALTLGPTMWAVRDLAEARAFYTDVIGADAGEPHVVEHGNFLRCFVSVGGGSLQLMQPLPGEQVLAAHIEKRGEGFYGQVLLTDDLAAARERLATSGVQVVAEEIDLGNMKETVLHPRSTRGVLTVLRQLIPDGGDA